MARKPYKYIIKLTEAERQALEALVRGGKTERRLADRARIILWADEGSTIAETQRRLGCSEQIVLNWRRDFLARRQEEGPVKALKDRPRPGRPRVFSP
jgi:DNA-binding CsgD family transcriptional regulator